MSLYSWIISAQKKETGIVSHKGRKNVTATPFNISYSEEFILLYASTEIIQAIVPQSWVSDSKNQLCIHSS